MAKTNAERQAEMKARRIAELAEACAKIALLEERNAELQAQLDAAAEAKKEALPARLPPGVTRARKNQYVEGGAVRPKLVRQDVPDLEVAKKAFSDRMRDARIAAGLTQADVAFALFGQDLDGTYRKRYINWEIGRSFMTQNVIPVFARLTGTDCNFLFGWPVAGG